MPTPKDINEMVGNLSRAWIDDWGQIFQGISERCDITLDQAMAFHTAMAVQKMAAAYIRVAEMQEKLVPRQMKALDMMDQGEEGDDWKKEDG